MDIEKMKAEEKELEKLLYGVQEDTSVDGSHSDKELPINDEDFDDDESAGQATTQIEETPDRSTAKVTRTSWKKRYASYKASTDSTLYELRQELAGWKGMFATKDEEISALKETMRNLKAEIQSKVDPYEGIITPEDEELIGTEAVDIIKKAVNARKQDTSQYDDLMDKVRGLEKEKTDRLKSESVNFRKASMTELKARLTEFLPEWTEIDIEPEFAAYMKDADPVSGLPRVNHYNTAVANRDIERILSFYKQFKSLKPRSKEEILAGKITPVGGGSSTSSREDKADKIYSITEYSQFMDSVARGDYRGTKELRLQAKQKERQFDKALMEGRVR